MIPGTCHCGAIRIELPAPPETVTDCNCSVCRRYGALWAFYTIDNVRVTGHPENTVAYIWGQKTIRTLHCRICGCVTHWESLDPASDDRVGINIRNFDPEDVGGYRVRRFDGADTWTYLD
jgi:hypothetical protein